jgi:hypothetical protein
MKVDRFNEETDKLVADALDDTRRAERISKLMQNRVTLTWLTFGLIAFALILAVGPVMRGANLGSAQVLIYMLIWPCLSLYQISSQIWMLRLVGGLKKSLEATKAVPSGSAV